MSDAAMPRSIVPLVALRAYVGVIWLTYGTSKFESNWAGGQREFLSAVKSVVPNTTEPFRSFLSNVVVPNQAVFAQLIAVGETLVGLALVLGLLTKAGAVGGMFLSGNYFVATGQFTSHFGVESLELLLFVLCLYLLLTPSGASFSLDGYFRKREKR